MARILQGGQVFSLLRGRRGRRGLNHDVMPSLFRFLVVLGLLGGLAYGGLFSLAHFVTPKPREITVTIPPDQFLKKQN